MASSEKWPFGRHTVPAWETSRARGALEQGLVVEPLPSDPENLQSQVGQWLVRPPTRMAGGHLVRWFGDDQPAANPEQGSGTLGDHRWGAERTGHGDVETGPVSLFTTEAFGPLSDHLDPITQSQTVHGTLEEGGPPAVGFDQDQLEVRPAPGDDQAGQSAP